MILLSLQVCLASGNLPVLDTWQHVALGSNVDAIGVVDGGFAAVLSNGRVRASTDARTWTTVAELQRDDRVWFNDAGLTVFAVRKDATGGALAAILHTSDLIEFETLLERELTLPEYALERPAAHYDNRNFWRRPLAHAGAGWIAIFDSGAYLEILYSEDGVQWTSTLFAPGWKFANAYRHATGDLLITHAVHSRWLRSADGLQWDVYSTFVGQYTWYNNQYVGLRTADKPAIFVSVNAEDWAELPVVLDNGPSNLIVGQDRLLIINIATKIWVSIDGVTWLVSTLPDWVGAGDGFPQTTGGFFNGRFWLVRTVNTPPGSPVDNSSQILSSVDGVNWIEEAALPAGYVNQGIPLTSVQAALPGSLAALPTGEQTIPVECTDAGVSVAIRARPEKPGTFALYHTDTAGTEWIVDTNWGVAWYFADLPAQPRQLLVHNGVFLCRTNNHFALYDAYQSHLPQPWVPNSLSADHETHIEVRWHPVAGADTYAIWRATGLAMLLSSEALEWIGETSATRWIDDDPDLVKKRNYAYAITAHAADGRYSLPGRMMDGRLWDIESRLDYYEWFEPWKARWVSFDWFGRAIYSDPFPWIWSLGHGWWCLHEVKYGFWVLDRHLGWLWTQSGIYPYFHQATLDRWLYYQQGTIIPRWFHDCAAGVWLEVE
jgi:hypothetical protein